MRDRSQKFFAIIESDGSISGYETRDSGSPISSHVQIVDAEERARITRVLSDDQARTNKLQRLQHCDGKVVEKPRVVIRPDQKRIPTLSGISIVSFEGVPEHIKEFEVRCGQERFTLSRGETLEIVSDTQIFTDIEVTDKRLWSDIEEVRVIHGETR